MLIPCNHCRRDNCRLCQLYATDARYRRLWSATEPPARAPNKPRISIADLAERKRH